MSEQPRVTVVNDNPDFLALIDEILADDAFTTTLLDGERGDALEQIRQSHPDVLMIDLRLGDDGLRGWDIARAVRQDADFAQLPILVCSADHQAMAQLGEDAAADRHLELLRKPFVIDEFTVAIQRLLESRASA